MKNDRKNRGIVCIVIGSIMLLGLTTTYKTVEFFGDKISYSYLQMYNLCSSPLGMFGADCKDFQSMVIVYSVIALFILGTGIYKVVKVKK